MDRERKEEEERKKLGIEKEEEEEEDDEIIGGPWKRLDADEIRKKVKLKYLQQIYISKEILHCSNIELVLTDG